MINGKRVHALLPMKAHSERVPNKNIKPFNGKPLYHHVLLMLAEVPEIDAIIINTDSDLISKEAPTISKKAIINPRPEAIRGDFVSMNRIIEHDIATHPSDIVMQTHSTNPVLRSSTVRAALTAFAGQTTYDSLFTVNAFQSRFYFEDGRAINHDPEVLLRTQDLPKVFEENSCLYVFTPKAFAVKQRRIGVKPMMFETPTVESVDIDNDYSFRLAEVLAANADRLIG